MKTFARELPPRAYWRARLKALGLQLEPERSPTRKACQRGHPDRASSTGSRRKISACGEYGVTNAQGFRRCRRCLAENQARHHAKKVKKARVVSPPPRHTRPAKAAVQRKKRAKKSPARQKITAPGPAPSAPAKVLSAEQRLELLKVRASAPRAPKPKKTVDLVAAVAGFVSPPANPATPPQISRAADAPPVERAVDRPRDRSVRSVKPPARTPPAGREREQLGIGFCNDCRQREPLFRYRTSGLCRKCHPYGALCDAA